MRHNVCRHSSPGGCNRSPYRIKFELYRFSSRQFHSVKRQALQAPVVERLDIASRVDVESSLSFDASSRRKQVYAPTSREPVPLTFVLEFLRLRQYAQLLLKDHQNLGNSGPAGCSG